MGVQRESTTWLAHQRLKHVVCAVTVQVLAILGQNAQISGMKLRKL